MADLSITAASVGIAALGTQYTTVQVGEAVTQGQPGYPSTADNLYYQTDANLSAAAAAATGVFLTAAATSGYAIFAQRGSYIPGATLTVGQTYCVSRTKGGICPIADLTTGDYVTILGVATTTTALTLAINASGTPKP